MPSFWKQNVHHTQAYLISWSIADTFRRSLVDVLLSNKTCNYIKYSICSAQFFRPARSPMKVRRRIHAAQHAEKQTKSETVRNQRDGAGQQTI